MERTRISKRSKILAASLLLYGFEENIILTNSNNNNHYSLVYKKNKKLCIKSILVKINKYRAEYNMGSGYNAVGLILEEIRPITKKSLTNILNALSYE